MTKRFTQIAMAIAVGSSIATTPVAAEGQSGDGYLLKQPRVTLKFESGYAFQQARSDIFDFVVEEHTLDGSEFNAPYFGGELGLRVNEKLDLSLSIGFQESSTESEFRDWVDQDDLPSGSRLQVH